MHGNHCLISIHIVAMYICKIRILVHFSSRNLFRSCLVGIVFIKELETFAIKWICRHRLINIYIANMMYESNF